MEKENQVIPTPLHRTVWVRDADGTWIDVPPSQVGDRTYRIEKPDQDND